MRDCAVRDRYGLAISLGTVEYMDNGWTNLTWEKLGRAQTHCTALVTQYLRYRLVVSRQPDSKSASKDSHRSGTLLSSLL